MVSNGSLVYDHDTDGTHTQLAGCEAPFRNKDFDTYVAIRYEDEKLTVSLNKRVNVLFQELLSLLCLIFF